MEVDELAAIKFDAGPEDVLAASSVHLLEADRLPVRADLASFLLLRFATLPYEVLEQLRPPLTRALVDRQLGAEAAMADEACALGVALFGLVSRIDAADRVYRRQVLQLKRDVHNASPSAIDASVLGRIEQDLRRGGTGEQARSLARWLAAQATLREIQTRLDEQLHAELAEVVRPALRAPLQVPLFKRALALASGGLIAHAQREACIPAKPNPDNFERSLLGYLIRAAAKTSPFSSFMSTTAVYVDPRQDARPQGVGLQHSCRVRLNRGVVSRLRRVMATRDGRNPCLSANPTLALVGGQRYRALCSRDMVVLGRPWRQQSVATFQLHETLSRALLTHMRQPPAPVGHWQERFVEAGVPRERVADLILQLLARDLLQLEAITDAFDPTPERALLDQLRANPGAGDLSTHPVHALVHGCEALAASDDGEGRVAKVVRLRELEVQALGDDSHEPYQNIALEDCWSSGMEGGVGARQLGGLEDVGRFLSSQIGLSPAYGRLRERFLAKYGGGGRCTDVLAFLADSGAQLMAPREYGDARGEEMGAAPSGATLPVTLQVQLADCANDAPLVVVNKVFEGAGWLAARFAFGESLEHGHLRLGLTRWLETVSAGRLPVDLVINGDSNDLQAHPRLTQRVLHWPGEPLRSDNKGILELGQLVLEHDTGNDLLELTDRDGQRLHLCYLGGTMPSPSWGIPYALAILTQPYQLMRPDHQPGMAAMAQEVEFVPRRVAGRAVLQRAHWWVSTAYLRRAWFGRQGGGRLVDTRRESARIGLPPVFFARRQAGASPGVSSSALDANRKPLWVDSYNPFCLSLLERLAEGTGWLCFTEALPGPDQLWLKIDGRAHVSELQAELLLRAR